MPWCPHCKYEYREGFSVCSDCGAELTDDLPVSPEPLPKPDETPVFLGSLSDGMEADMLEAVLLEAGIVVRRNYKELGIYLKIVMGYNAFGVDFWVPASRLSEAREVLAAQTVPPGAHEEFAPEEDDEMRNAMESRNRCRRALAWVAALIAGSGALVYAALLLAYFISRMLR